MRLAYLVPAILAFLVLAPMAGLLNLGRLPEFEPQDLQFWQSAYIRRVVFFSLWQALLSALLSVIPAILVARAFAQHGDFPFRSLLLRLFGLPLVVPSVVAVMGIVSVYGSNGWIPIGRSLYGINGILLAHVFFNLPLAVRLLLPLWQGIPQHHWQLGEQMGFSGWHRWRYLEWPVLREGLPGVLLLVFMLCLTSFAVVLTLGGGPKSTTLEVAIYQSLRFDFDPVQAVILAMLQLSLCFLVAVVLLRFQKLPEVEISIASSVSESKNYQSLLNRVVIAAAGIYVGLPLASLLTDALSGPLGQVLANGYIWQSAAKTLMLGMGAAVLSVIAGWFLLRGSSQLANRGQLRRARLIELSGSIIYVVPPLVIGTGIFVLLSEYVDVFTWVYPVVIVVNAMMGLPFVIRTLGPAMRQNAMRYRYLCHSLALGGWNRFRIVDWPLLRRPIGLSAALVAALAMGDLGVIALFGTADTATLPLVIYQQLGAYLIPQATATALLLLGLCLLVFWVLEHYIGGKADA
jgi:thiamine transport system permease protein